MPGTVLSGKRSAPTPPLSELTATVHINVADIPDFRRIELAKGALSLVDQAFAMPGAEERYQAWLAERRGRKQKTAQL